MEGVSGRRGICMGAKGGGGMDGGQGRIGQELH